MVRYIFGLLRDALCTSVEGANPNDSSILTPCATCQVLRAGSERKELTSSPAITRTFDTEA